MQELLNVDFKANLKLFLRLSNCASFGEKTLTLPNMFKPHWGFQLVTEPPMRAHTHVSNDKSR
jgi:hypothetical protein